MLYKNNLPDGCPPSDAAEINEPLRKVRLTKEIPPSEDDFKPHNLLYPEKDYKGKDDCPSRSLSLTDEVGGRKAITTPKFKGYCLAQIELPPGSGRIKKTGKAFEERHWSFWAYQEFEISQAKIAELK